MKIIGYSEFGSVLADFGEGVVSVPDNMDNRHRQEIAEWEAEGKSIPPYVAVVVVPDSVSARQFKLQLLAVGLLDNVDSWVKTQSRAVQIAYEYSGSFVRTEPMMATGFKAMGFADKQIDDFFTAAMAL